MNTAKMTLASTALAAALGLALGLPAAPAEAHGDSTNCLHKDPNHKHCLPPDDGGDTPSTGPTEVQWGGDIDGITEPRPCVLEHVHPNGNNGNYTCQLVPPGPVAYNLGVGTQTARNGDPLLCDVFANINLTPNSRYTYFWFDNCGDGSCTMNILNWFGGDQVLDATGGKADFIKLVAWTEAMDGDTGVGGATGVIDDPNPFANSHTLLIDEITISFSAEGSHKNIAVCEYSPDLFNLIVGDVTFRSDPM